MASRRLTLVVALVLLVAGGFVLFQFFGPVGPYERTTVTVVDENGTTLAAVDARVADTTRKRYVGLSNTESLGSNEGMLFVHPSVDTHAYVMRDMDFPLDIVFADADGTIATIHHARLPPPGTGESALTRYRGRAKYVLEVPYGYTNQTGIEVGDRLVVGDG
ncbi:MAG: DUF192 domain-containing protein [Halobacteriota archaeon]